MYNVASEVWNKKKCNDDIAIFHYPVVAHADWRFIRDLDRKSDCIDYSWNNINLLGYVCIVFNAAKTGRVSD